MPSEVFRFEITSEPMNVLDIWCDPMEGAINPSQGLYLHMTRLRQDRRTQNYIHATNGI